MPTEFSTLVLSTDDVDALGDWAELIEAVHDAYSGPIADEMVPARGIARGSGVWMRSLTAVSPTGSHVGAKLITFSTVSRQASYLIALFDQRDARLTGLLDGDRVTGYRTAATSMVAARALMHDEPTRVAVIGSGFEATNHLAALSAIARPDQVRVYSPSARSREAYVARARAELGWNVTAADSAGAAIDGANLVICAARSRDESPTVQGRWIKPGATVVSIGSTLPEQRELDVATLDRADLIVADMVDEVVNDTGDLIAARDAGVTLPSVVPLSGVIAGQHPGRTSGDQVVVYKSVGSALQDVVVAELLLTKAEKQGRGTRIAAPAQPVSK